VADVGDTINFELTQGEDWIVQLFWTDEYGSPMTAASDPCQMDVKDGTGQLLAQFLPSNATASAPQIVIGNASGVIQITAPSAVTATWDAGTYNCDIFATYYDPSMPFTNQSQAVAVCSGLFTVLPAISNPLVAII
jgi:hypothetical protein